MEFSKLRQFFPFFNSEQCTSCDGKEGCQNIFLDNAATTQKPKQVIDRIAHYYACENASVYRGLYSRAESATYLYEQARAIVANFIGAHPDEIIFTKGTTEGINFIAATWATKNLVKDDEIILSELEHNANVLPWMHLAETKGIKLKFISIDESGNLDYQVFQDLINKKTKLVSLTHRANSIGTKINVDFIMHKARENGIPVLIDAAQTIAHEKIDVTKMAPNFLVFSSHKLLGPTGIGVLYINRAMQEVTPPYQFGGGMVSTFDTSDRSCTWLTAPRKYEAGTPQIAQALGLAEGIQFINKYIDFDALKAHQIQLTTQLLSGLKKLNQVKILGPTDQLLDSPIISFYSERFHAHDIAAYLDQFNIAVRAGNQCAQLIYNKLGIAGSLRISTYFYNTVEEIDFLLSKLEYLLG